MSLLLLSALLAAAIDNAGDSAVDVDIALVSAIGTTAVLVAGAAVNIAVCRRYCLGISQL